MSTHFFDRQDTARSNTLWLIILFIAAVVGLVGATSLAGYAIGTMVGESGYGHQGGRQPHGVDVDPLAVAGLFGVATAIVILLGSLYQITALRLGGGTRVAESVGGRQIHGDTRDPAERRLMNIVEEMAIASGTPVPPVYVLEEDAINAFAAGYKPGDAVIGVTRGAMDKLTREQLQGVIAHEFSHIFNGDMRMNIRMIGILHGILLLGLIGHMLLRTVYYSGGHRSRSSDSKSDGRITLLLAISGLILIVAGSIGSFIGGLIKAAVSRQREFLADASAVQFTRNPDGIAGALKRIGGYAKQGRLQHPNASMASHMYFAQGVFEGLTGLLATHPPLHERIKAIDPAWDGTFDEPKDVARQVSSATRQSGPRQPLGASGFAGAEPPAVPLPEVMGAVQSVGAPEAQHHHYSAMLLHDLDAELIDAAHEAYSARALVLALLLDPDRDMRQRQFAVLQQMISADVVALTDKLYPKVAAAPDAARLPLVDLSLPMLRTMTAPQYKTFSKALEAMIKADHRLTIFEWTLSRVLLRHLRSQYVPAPRMTPQFHRLQRLNPEVSVLLSTLARVGHSSREAAAAFQVAAEHLPGLRLTLLPPAECSFAALDAALDKLARASAHRRAELLTACAASVSADGIVKVKEAELLRGIADLLDCPMPPLVGRIELQAS